MVKLALLALFMMVVVCAGVYALWTIEVSQQQQENLASEFKKTDSALQKTGDSLNKKTTSSGAFKRDSFRLPEIELAIKANAITNAIDSIKHELAFSEDQKRSAPFTYPDARRILALKNSLAGFNAFIQTHFQGKPNINAGDLVPLSDVPNGNTATPWEVYYFRNSSVLAMITELTFIKTRVLRLQQKATN